MTFARLIKWLALYFLVCPVFAHDLPRIREVPVAKLFEFDRLKPKPDDSIFLQNRRYLDLDKDRAIYILDRTNHRILKFTEEGKFLAQIGSIGQNGPDLYYPSAVRVSGDRLYVSDQAGRWIKVFTQDGKFIFRIESAVKRDLIDCFDVFQGRVYCGLRKVTKEFNKNSLVTVFDEKGERMAEFGDVLKCKNIYAYMDFNSALFSFTGGALIGAFTRYPAIFKYKPNGEKVYQKDLRLMDLEAIRVIADGTARQVKDPYDTPEHMNSSEGWVHYMTYCRGFDVDENSEAYYAAWGFRCSPVVYRFSPEGKVIEVLKFKYGDKDVAPLGIFINRSLRARYGVGGIVVAESVNKPFFFKF